MYLCACVWCLIINFYSIHSTRLIFFCISFLSFYSFIDVDNKLMQKESQDGTGAIKSGFVNLANSKRELEIAIRKAHASTLVRWLHKCQKRNQQLRNRDLGGAPNREGLGSSTHRQPRVF